MQTFLMTKFTRRGFIHLSGLGVTPALVSPTLMSLQDQATAAMSPVRFYGDGQLLEPTEYIDELQRANVATAIVKDRYGIGGVVEALEKKFVQITGKEKAIYMLSGTMANQLAISVLSGSKSKVFVQDESHIYRDEADAAQTVFGKRLIPLAKGEPGFTAVQLQAAIDALPEQEVFASGIGAVSVETPVRRMDGRVIPYEDLKQVSNFCRSKGIPLHIDGARIFIASAWSGIPVRDYAALSDTFYVSLYKYLGASAGAILCGPATVIDQMPHLIKIHGGSMYGNWTNAAMALNRIDALEETLRQVVQRSKALFEALNKLKGLRVEALPGGTNIFRLTIDSSIDARRMHEKMRNDHNIVFARPDKGQQSLLTVNETMLSRPLDALVQAFRSSIA